MTNNKPNFKRGRMPKLLSSSVYKWGIVIYALTLAVPNFNAQVWADNFPATGFAGSNSDEATNAWGIYDNANPIGATRMNKVKSNNTDKESNPELMTDATGNFRRFKLWTYNPDKPGSFQGTEIFTKKLFGLSELTNQAGRARTFEARIRISKLRPGIVAGFFPEIGPYGDNDELDFEFLGNLLPENKLWLNTFNDGRQLPDPALIVPGVTWSNWNNYKFKWSENRVEWFVNGASKKTVEFSSSIPDEKLQVHLNIWVPRGDFGPAHDSSFSPARTTGEKEQYYFDVMWVKTGATAAPKGKPTRRR